MKKTFFTAVLTLVGSSFLFAQQWTGANNTTSDISRTGKVSINTTSTTDNLNVNGSIGISGNSSLKVYSSSGESYNFGVKLISTSIPSTLDYALFIGPLSKNNTFIMYNNKIGMGSQNFFCTDCDDYRLFVKDGIRTEKIKVDIAANNGWADYVFEPGYNLMPLTEVEQFIKENGHLPEVPTTEEAIANGIELKEMNILLLKKVEELTLYSIELQKRIEALESQTTHK